MNKEKEHSFRRATPANQSHLHNFFETNDLTKQLECLVECTKLKHNHIEFI